MATTDVIKLIIDEKAHSYAKIYASLLNEEFQRKRSYASIVALYAFLNKIQETPFTLQSSMTLFRHPMLNEQYEISDLYVNNWHLDVRVLINGDYVLVPKIHYESNITPDFYVVVRVDSSLQNAELLGFIDAKQTQKEGFDYHYYKVPCDSLIGYEEFLSKVHNEKNVLHSEEDHELFKNSYLAMIDGELDAETKNKILKHLFECNTCRTEFCCFTGFEMVSANSSKYPEILEDHTLGFIGAQNIDEVKYEGKEETIYIGDDPEEKLEFERQQKQEKEQQETQTITEEKEETVSDILDELFNLDEGTIEIETQKDKLPETEIIPLDLDNKTEIIEENPDNTEIDELEAALDTHSDSDFVLIDANENNEFINQDEPTSEIIEFIDENASEESEEFIIKENDSTIASFDDEIIDEATMLSQEENIHKVVVDYDEEGNPVYSYITEIEPENENSSELEIITEIEDTSVEDIFSTEDEISEIETIKDITENLTEYNQFNRESNIINEENFDIEQQKDAQENSVLLDDNDAFTQTYDDSFDEVSSDENETLEIEEEDEDDNILQLEDSEEEIITSNDDETSDTINDNTTEDEDTTLENYDNSESDVYNEEPEEDEDNDEYENLDNKDVSEEYEDSDDYEYSDDDEDYEDFNEYEDEYDVEDYLPEEQIKKSSAKPFTIIISIFLLLVFIGCGAMFFAKNSKPSNLPELVDSINESSTPKTEDKVVNDMFEQPAQQPQATQETKQIQEKTNENTTVKSNTPDPVPAPPIKDATPVVQKNNIELKDLTEEDLIKPQKAKAPADVNSALINAFSNNVPVSMKALNWFCAPELFSNKDFKVYLQTIDNTLKQNLKNNFMNTVEKSPKSSVAAKFAIDNKGKLKKVVISESSGSTAIDNIVLQSINETFQAEKSQNLNDIGLNADTFYLKVVIKL